MSAETAQTILVATTMVAAVIWLVGLWFLVGSYRTKRTDRQADHFAHSEQLPAHWFLGSVEVDGQSSALVDKAASILVRQNPASLRILDKSNDRLAFEWIGPLLAGQPRRGQLRFASLGSGRTRVDYAIEPPAYRWLLWLGVSFQLCGLIALVVGGWVIYEYCLPSPNAEIRAQAIQMVQVVHFLWPPFLFGALYRQRRAATEGFELLLRNLPFLPA